MVNEWHEHLKTDAIAQKVYNNGIDRILIDVYNRANFSG